MISRAYVSFWAIGGAVMLALVAAALCSPPRATAQSFGLDPAAMLKPPTDAWPTYNGDYTGRRYSPVSASATAHSSAAEDDSPAPAGRSASMARSAPPGR